MNLEPAYQAYQYLLSDLYNKVHLYAQGKDKATVTSINEMAKHQALLLCLAFITAGIATVFYKRVSKQSRQKSLSLSEVVDEKQLLDNSLLKSKHQYQMLFDKNPIPMWVFDQNSYKFLQVNEAAQREYGYSQEEFLQKTILEIRPESDTDEVIKRLSEIGKENFASSVRRHKRKNGSIFYAEVSSHALPPEGNTQPRLVAAVNIHERVQALEEINKREKQLKEVSSSIPGIVYQFKLSKRKEYAFTFISEGINKLTDVSPDAIYQAPELLLQYIHPEDLALVKESVECSYKNLTPWELEFRVNHPSTKKSMWLRGHSIPTYGEDEEVTWNGTFINITKLKEAQVKLIESEASLHALLNSSPQAIFSLDQELNITMFNAVAAKEIKKFFLKDLATGQNFLDFIVPEKKACVTDSHARALKGRTVKFEEAVNDFFYEIIFRPVLNKNAEVLAVSIILRDISEHRNAIKTIKQNEAQLARAQELAKMGNFEYNALTDTLTWSDGVYKVFQVTKETFTPTLHSFKQRIHPEDRDTLQQEINRVFSQKLISNIEYCILLQNGSTRHVYQITEPTLDANNNIIKISGSIQDITERKLAEREITEAKNLLQSTIENVPEVIFSFDTSLNITYVSPQSVEITGYNENDYRNNAGLWLETMYPADRDKFLNHVVPNLLTGKRQQQEVRKIGRTGEMKWLLLRISPMKNEKGKIIRFDASASDMTQYKIAEAKRNELTEQLIRQNQNLQQFAYIVSHNLRAPIANILGLTSIYDRAKAEAPMNQRVIDGLVKSAQLLDTTIQDLNDILSIRNEENLVKEEIAFEDVLKDVLESISEKVKDIDASIEYNFKLAPTVVSVRSYVYSIIQNLVTNAIKYRSSNRKLHLNLNTTKDSDYICLRISDNGCGINLAKEKDKIFGLYKRFHSNTSGKGIGLHLVKTQAEMLGGRVEVESEVNVGTTFKVYIKA
ncbi:PAS domain S-box protein [Pontibacter silvestris]|uniref:histidine kinase n=1 Tax=Pontibacter silvestris TaxID=2305183 RepID=A0ABW4X457_9BACT|nr:PAS domain S-box protein [Pontibacter silvestris]MCC9135024.1 PAS domain S-box protein [Pontibacter silvestris]